MDNNLPVIYAVWRLHRRTRLHLANVFWYLEAAGKFIGRREGATMKVRFSGGMRVTIIAIVEILERKEKE